MPVIQPDPGVPQGIS